MDSKDRKYQQQVQKVLVGFEELEEWPDYIAFLNKLQKTIQSNRSTTNHWIPNDLDIAIILSKCLSPNLPSGVHQKSLEIYQLVFKELGIDTLSSNVNVWIPGILPIIQYASISIKPMVIQLHKDFLLTLPSNVLKPLIKPILSYLLCSIDDERSEFFDVSLELIDKFKVELNDDSLFWQSIFMILITSDEKSLGALIWCNKRLPSLNIPVNEDEDTNFKKDLSSEQLALVEPEPGLLIRAFISALDSENLLIQRGFFDLLIKNLPLNSVILQKLSNRSDLQNLIITVVNTILKKDMSLNRRVWNWLLGDLDDKEYFQKFGYDLLIDSLLKLIDGDYYENSIKKSYLQKISSFKICLAIMDKWEIGLHIIPKIFLPFLNSIKLSENKFKFNEILKNGMILFDSIETLIIFQNLFNEVNSNEDYDEFLLFVLRNFNFTEEEMIIHQLPLLLISTLINEKNSRNWFDLIKVIFELLPQRAFLSIDHSNLTGFDKLEILDKINNYYNNNDEILNLPFKAEDLSFILLNLIKDLIINSINDENLKTFKYLEILNILIDLIPEYQLNNEEILDLLLTNEFGDPLITIQFVKIFNKFKFNSPFIKLKILKNLIHNLCFILYQKNFKYQIEVVKSIQSLTLENDPYFVEASISTYLLSLNNFNKRLEIFNYLWIHSTDFKFLNRPLFIILDDLNNNDITNSIISKWLLNCCNNGFSNRLFQIITLKIYESLNDFELFQYYCSLLLKILNIDESIFELFNDELIVINSIEFQDLNGYTFKDFSIWIILKFINENSNDLEFFNSKNLNSIFKLLELLLNFKSSEKINNEIYANYLLKIFNVSQKFISNESNLEHYNEDYDLISIVLINHLNNLIKLSNNIDSIILMKNDKDESLLIEFLLLSFNKFNKPELLIILLNLLNNLLKFQNELIFNYVEIILITILNKINYLYDNDNNSKDDVSISLLLTNLNEVLSLLRTYVITLEVTNPNNSIENSDANHNNGFFTNVVSNVFNNSDSNKIKELDLNSNSAQFRKIFNDCLNKTISACFKIWSNSDLILKKNNNNYKDDYDYDGYLSLKYQSIKLKHKSKQLFESIFELEPLIVLKQLVFINNKELNSDVFKLLHALDGTRPQLTMPKIFKLFDEFKFNSNGLEIVKFLNDYTITLQDDSIEDVFNINISFLKEVLSIDGINKLILLNLLNYLSILSLKLSRCKFGLERFVKKEINDVFIKLLPLALNSKELLIDGEVNQEDESLKLITNIIPNIKIIVLDSDKQNNLISSILVNLISKDFKSKKFPNEIRENQLLLLIELLKNFNSNKNLKMLISDMFNDFNFFKIKFDNLTNYNLIIKHWLSLNEDTNLVSNEKLLEYLNKVVLNNSSTVNIFNWNDDDLNLSKLLNLRKISYILLISNRDEQITILKELFNRLDQLLIQQYSSGNELVSLLNSEIFILIRVLVLKISPMNLINYWTIIYTTLQRFFNSLLKELQKDDIKVSFETVLQACKLLDVLLILKFEDFQEWIFIIDTINAILRKYEVISLIDKISIEELKLNKETENKLDLTGKITNFKGLKEPSLLGVKKIESINSLNSFFQSLSYYNYENIYNGILIDYESCIQDIFQDLFI